MVDADIYDTDTYKKDDVSIEEPGVVRNITIRITSTDLKTIKRVSNELLSFISVHDPEVKSPVVVPREEAVFTIRKSPCGNGTATFSRIRMRVEQRVFDVRLNDRSLNDVVDFLKGTSVDAVFEMMQ